MKISNTPRALLLGRKKLILSIAISLCLVSVLAVSVNAAEAALGLDTNIRQVKTADDPTVYFLDHERGMKKAYLNEEAYLSYGNKWSDIHIVSQTELNRWFDIYLVKTEAEPAVYNIYKNRKSVIMSEHEFRLYGFNWNDIVTISQADLETYKLTDLKFGGGPGLSANSLTVQIDNSSPVKTYVTLNTRDNLVAVFNIRSNAGSVKITGLDVLLDGFFHSQVIDKVKLVDMEDVTFNYEVSLNEKAASFNLNANPLVIPASNDRLIGIYVDTGDYEDTYGLYFRAVIAGISAIDTQATVYGAFPIAGALMSVISDSGVLGQVVAQQKTVNYYANTVIIGNTNQALVKYNVNEISDQEDVVIKEMTFKNYGGAWTTDVSNFKLVDANNKIIAQVINLNNDRKIKFILNDYKINKNSGQSFIVYGDVISGDGRTIKLKLEDIKITGENYGLNLYATINHIQDDIIIIREKIGVISRALVSNSKVYKEQAGSILGLFEIRSDNQQVRLESIDVNLSKNSLAGSLTNNVYLISYNTGEVISSVRGQALTSGSVNLRLNEKELKPKSELVIALVSEIPGAAVNGATYKINVNQVTYWAGDNRLYADEVNVAGETLIVGRANIYIYDNDAIGEQMYIKGQTGAKIGSFILEASAGESVKINSITLAKGDTSGSVTYDNGFSNLRIYAGSRKLGTTITRPYDQSYSFDGFSYTIRAGKRVELKVYVDININASISATRMMVSNLVAIGSSNGIKARVHGLNTNSHSTSFGKLDIEMASLGGGSVAAGENNNIVGSFSLTNTGDEAVYLRFLTINTSKAGFSYSLGYSNLSVVFKDINRRIGTIVRPVSGSNQMYLENSYLNPGSVGNFDIYVNARADVGVDNFNLSLVNLIVKGKYSKIEVRLEDSVTNEVVVSGIPGDDDNGESEGYVWPVSGTIAYSFNDPDYFNDFGFIHEGIDIITAQGTDVKATASGTVTHAVDGGLGYSYIVVEHDNNIKTVYGHIFEIQVSEGQSVSQGEIIGLSGGAIGEPGSGLNTSGPHLHFEVKVNNTNVDPENYLP